MFQLLFYFLTYLLESLRDTQAEVLATDTRPKCSQWLGPDQGQSWEPETYARFLRGAGQTQLLELSPAASWGENEQKTGSQALPRLDTWNSNIKYGTSAS